MNTKKPRYNSKKEYLKWIETASKLPPPMTNTQHDFAMFLFKNLKELDKIGNVEPIFQSVYHYIKHIRK